jgi:hypothetical protein
MRFELTKLGQQIKNNYQNFIFCAIFLNKILTIKN